MPARIRVLVPGSALIRSRVHQSCGGATVTLCQATRINVELTGFVVSAAFVLEGRPNTATLESTEPDHARQYARSAGSTSRRLVTCAKPPSVNKFHETLAVTGVEQRSAGRDKH